MFYLKLTRRRPLPARVPKENISAGDENKY